MLRSILNLLPQRLLTTALAVLLPCLASADQQQDLQFSGFSRLIAGVSQHENPAAQAYDSSISIKPNSLAIQADWQIVPAWSVTSQGIAHLNDKKNQASNGSILAISHRHQPGLNLPDCALHSSPTVMCSMLVMPITGYPSFRSLCLVLL